MSDKSSKKKLDPFPIILHRILSDSSFSDIIEWAPHGRAWKVQNNNKFLKEVTPKFFKLKHYKSFLRQVTGWGFTRIKEGKDKGSYFHKVSFKPTINQILQIIL